MNVASDYEAPMQMLTMENYIAPGAGIIIFFRIGGQRGRGVPCKIGDITQ